MTESISENHPLRTLFREALDKAFLESEDLYSPQVAAHLRDEVLCDFIHVDRVFRLKGTEGRALEELPQMLQVSLTTREGPERRLEVDSYIGDYTLFMSGFFPSSLGRSRWQAPNPMVSKVGGIFVSFQEPIEYYAAEGRNAYGRAAETARIFAPEVRETFSMLAEGYPRYTDLLRRVKTIISDDPELRKIEGLLD
jgi:hypothetical protein